MREAAQATSTSTSTKASAQDGVPYWDTGAPGLAALGRLAPAAVRSVQRPRARRQLGGGHRRAGLLRLGAPDVGGAAGDRYTQAGLRGRRRRLSDPAGPYLSTDASHHGLLLHSVYHWPNGGITCRRSAACRAASRASGATTTCVRSRSTCAPRDRRALPDVLRSGRDGGRA
jgi:hypothetical protein